MNPAPRLPQSGRRLADALDFDGLGDQIKRHLLTACYRLRILSPSGSADIGEGFACIMNTIVADDTLALQRLYHWGADCAESGGTDAATG